ncbi:uncharacterized protein [Littorina saxatilis]|uniref:uncharacterized protein n=1 Tax=Littorina saxatilis TaxID=31220 RepID=UPI0038B633F9
MLPSPMPNQQQSMQALLQAQMQQQQQQQQQQNPQMQMQQMQAMQQQMQQQQQQNPQMQMQQMQAMQQQQQQQQQMQQQQPNTQMQTQAPNAAQVDFDFKGFFDYFVKIYGKNALVTFQQRLDDRKTVEGIAAPAPTAAPASNVLPGLPIPCGLAPDYNGASLTYDNPSRPHGSLATYRCERGYKGAEAIIMCNSGAWTLPKVNVTCTQVLCGPTPVMPNAQIMISGDRVGSTATYTCDPGYQADNIASPIMCQETGQWSTPSFQCANMLANNQAMSQSMASMGMGALMGGGMGGMGGGAANAMQGMGGQCLCQHAGV